MASKDLAKRFQKAFQEPEKVKVEEYQKIIGANASKAAENAERLTFILLGLVMILILVIQGIIKKLDLGFVEIDGPSIILISTPILIAYIHYDLIATLSKFDLLSVIYKSIIKQRHPSIHEQRLAKYFLFLPTLYENKYLSKEGVVWQMQFWLWLAEIFIITVVISFGSELIAFRKLLAFHNPEYFLLLIISIVITAMLSTQSALTIFMLFQGTGDK